MSLQAFLAERNAALLALDLGWARRQVSGGRRPEPSDEMLLTSMHKARVECVALPEEPRRESARWLRERGLARLTGEPADPDDLPTADQ